MFWQSNFDKTSAFSLNRWTVLLSFIQSGYARPKEPFVHLISGREICRNSLQPIATCTDSQLLLVHHLRSKSKPWLRLPTRTFPVDYVIAWIDMSSAYRGPTARNQHLNNYQNKMLTYVCRLQLLYIFLIQWKSFWLEERRLLMCIQNIRMSTVLITFQFDTHGPKLAEIVVV